MSDAERRAVSTTHGQSEPLSGTDALAVLETIEACLAVDDEAAFRTRIWPKIETLFDFSWAAASVVSAPSSPEGLHIGSFVNYNLPVETCIAYSHCGWEHDDVVIEEYLRGFRTQYWSGTTHTRMVPATGETGEIPADNRCCEVLMACGVRSGYLGGIGSSAPDDPVSLISFSSSDGDAFDARVEPILHHVLPHMHLALLRATRHDIDESPATPLSARECEVLDWLKAGKSSWDISRVLGLSERTVNFHVYNLMRKLGAINRPQAVAIGLRRGLISLD